MTHNGDFINDPLHAGTDTGGTQAASSVQGRLQEAGRQASATAAETWEQAKVKAGVARERTEFYVRENPVPSIIGALAIGLVIGLAIRYASRPEEKEIEVKSSLANFDWASLSLPFLWPLFKSVKEKVEDSTEAVKESASRLKKQASDRWDDVDVDKIVKPLRKRWNAWS